MIVLFPVFFRANEIIVSPIISFFITHIFPGFAKDWKRYIRDWMQRAIQREWIFQDRVIYLIKVEIIEFARHRYEGRKLIRVD